MGCCFYRAERIPNASIYNIQGEENKLSCNISLNNYLQLEENEFVLINVCRNTTITTTFTTTDEYGKIPLLHYFTINISGIKSDIYIYI